MGLATQSFALKNFDKSSVLPTETYISDLSSKLWNHTQQSETLIHISDNISTPNVKFQFKGFWKAYAVRSELIIEAAIAQLNTFTKTVLIFHRKSDLIFPFHYFW